MNIVNDHKRCAGCEQVLPRSAYHVRRASPDGLQRLCIACARTVVRDAKRRGRAKTRVAVPVSPPPARRTPEPRPLTTVVAKRCVQCDHLRMQDRFTRHRDRCDVCTSLRPLQENPACV